MILLVRVRVHESSQSFVADGEALRPLLYASQPKALRPPNTMLLVQECVLVHGACPLPGRVCQLRRLQKVRL